MVFTDHKPLTYTISFVSHSWTAPQCRQLAYVAEYNSDIQYIAGVSNIIADTSSRPRGHVSCATHQVSTLPLFPVGGQSAENGQQATSSPNRLGLQTPTSTGVGVGAAKPMQQVTAAVAPITLIPAADFVGT
jgi:hypothetical protein